MLELIIMRHAHAGEAQTDFTRPLINHGREEAKKVGEIFSKKKLIPDFALVSPAARTEETYKLISTEWSKCKTRFLDKLYNGPVHALMEALSECPKDANCVILIAHNPGVSILAEELSLNPHYIGFRPSDWCHMKLNIEKWGDIHPACATILDNA